MKNISVLETTQKNAKYFRCPHCNKVLKLNKSSLQCKNNHNFDLAAKGYFNFVPHQPQTIYSSAMFHSKRKVYSAGFYKPVADKLLAIIEPFYTTGKTAKTCLDAGCGEGYYSGVLYDGLNSYIPTQFYAMDIEREGIKLAAPSNTNISWFTGDINHLPLKKKSIDVIFNILTPANYAEFERVLAPGGKLVKVIPGQHYLTEIRQNIKELLKNSAYDDKRVLEYFQKNCKNIKTHEICYTMDVPPDLSSIFYETTPMTQGLDLHNLQLPLLKNITIHMQILIGEL